MSLKKSRKASLKEAYILQELFLDQLTFKLGAVLDLYTFNRKNKRELMSFIDQLKEITHENLKLLRPYYDHRK